MEDSMITNNPNIAITKQNQQGRNTQQATGQMRAFSQSQSPSVAIGLLPESPSLQNIIALIQQLIQQLQQQESGGQEQTPAQEQDKEKNTEQTHPAIPVDDAVQLEDEIIGVSVIRGTSGDDRLNGTRDGDHMSGLAGNDRLYGRQGDDLLLGGEGNDRLYGGQGNDLLQGGAGNDHLLGGSGENTLFGGDGNDTLYSRLGSDRLDGGHGNDTARVRASIDDFSIAFKEVPTPVIGLDDGIAGERPDERDGISSDSKGTLILTNEKTGQTIEATNIEQFKFNDARLSFDELKEKATNSPTPNDQLLDLSASQKERLFDLFEPRPSADAAIRVIDRDGSGTISVGDEAVAATGGASSVSQQFRILSAEDVAAINSTTEPMPNPDPATLNLTDAQHAAIGARFNHQPAPNVSDGITTRYTGIATDKNADGKLGEGDTVQLQVSGGLLGLNEIQEHVLTADDIAAIEADRSNPLLDISNGLSFEQKQRLHTAIFGDRISLDSPSIQSVIDNNSDQKLSVGDTVLIQRFSENTGATSIEFHTLTQEELDTYLNGSASHQQARTDFEANKQKWNDSRPNSYRFTLERSGFIGGEARKPVDLTVIGNTVTNAQFSDGTNGQVPAFNQLSIDELFKTIEQGLDNNAAEVRVEYNSATGIPESIFIDQSQLIADEELFLSTSNFQLLSIAHQGAATE